MDIESLAGDSGYSQDVLHDFLLTMREIAASSDADAIRLLNDFLAINNFTVRSENDFTDEIQCARDDFEHVTFDLRKARLRILKRNPESDTGESLRTSFSDTLIQNTRYSAVRNALRLELNSLARDVRSVARQCDLIFAQNKIDSALRDSIYSSSSITPLAVGVAEAEKMLSRIKALSKEKKTEIKDARARLARYRYEHKLEDIKLLNITGRKAERLLAEAELILKQDTKRIFNS